MEAPVVLVTGASSGIGRATALELARRGVRVALAARRADTLHALATSIDASGWNALALPGDIRDAADRARWIERTLGHFGRLDVLVNNAGHGVRGPLELLDLDAIRANFETNVFGLIGLTQAALPHFRERGSGRIVNVGSVAGRIPRPFSGCYDATKHALEAFHAALRNEVRPFGIKTVLVRPGFILSEFADNADRAAPREAGPYAGAFAKSSGGRSRLHRLAAPAEAAARTIAHAALCPHPRRTYAVPAHAKVFLLLRALLPDAVFDRVLTPR
jgi:short-subunit dehydrogenase